MDVIRGGQLVTQAMSVFFCAVGINDLCVKYFLGTVFRIRSAAHKATGVGFCTSPMNLEREESFDVNKVDEATEVLHEIICDDELLMIKNRVLSL